MTLEACTELLRQHDPDRFGVVLTARPDQRPALVTLYALNLELARAPFQSNEPMLAEMRLQWWVERLAEMGTGKAPPLHDILTPLWQEWGQSCDDMVRLAEARRRDCERTPFQQNDGVIEYVAATAGTLMWLAASRLGAGDELRGIVADQAEGTGLAAWLRALPQLRQLGLGLVEETPKHVKILSGHGLEAMQRAAAFRRQIPKSLAPALYPGPRAAAFLARLVRKNGDDLDQLAEVTPFERRASLAKFSVTGRWWL